MSHIIQKEGCSKYSERGSNFFGFLYPLSSVSEFRIKLKEIRHKHLSSTHVCSAYRIIQSKTIQEKGSDDGEPRGSAGIPILNELKRVDIVNVGMFVVRYYGGRKLGIPGLIHSYTEITKLAISICSLFNLPIFSILCNKSKYSSFDSGSIVKPLPEQIDSHT